MNHGADSNQFPSGILSGILFQDAHLITVRPADGLSNQDIINVIDEMHNSNRGADASGMQIVCKSGRHFPPPIANLASDRAKNWDKSGKIWPNPPPSPLLSYANDLPTPSAAKRRATAVKVIETRRV